MKRKNVLLPMLAVMIAVGGAFASHNFTVTENVTNRPPISGNNCEACEGIAETNCTTEETENPCECTLTSGAVQGLNSICKPLFRPNP